MRRILTSIVKKTGLLAHIKLRLRSPLAERRWYRSYRLCQAIDADGTPLPMFSYSAIDFLTPRIGKDMTVFEYGAGHGTLWWAAHSASVDAVEHDRTWYDMLSRRLPKNVNLIYAELDNGSQYVNASIDTNKSFDIIVVDGRKRSECARAAIEALKPGGVLIWDDMTRERYHEQRDQLHAQGFKSIVFSGIGPGDTADHATTVFYRTDNCLGI